MKNWKVVNHQSGMALMKLNQFADWFDSEYHDLIRLTESPITEDDQIQPLVPKNQKFGETFKPVNWTQHLSVVQPVKDMTNITLGNGKKRPCANSYAFAVSQMVESFIMIESGHALNLSVQQLMDCSSSYKAKRYIDEAHTLNHRCQSGSLRMTMLYAKTFPLAREEEYPYKGYEA